MNFSYVSDLKLSFYLWCEHQILKKSQDVNYRTGEVLYRDSDPTNEGYYAYNARYKPWVADESLSGVTLPNGFATGTGCFVDNKNGRILSPADLGQTITGNFTSTRISVNISNSDEEEILFETQYHPNGRFNVQSGTGTPPYKNLLPAVFLNFNGGENKPLAFGGEDETVSYVTAVIISNEDYYPDTIGGILRDSNNEIFSTIPMESSPYGAFFNTTGSYNYDNFQTSYASASAQIKEASMSRISRGLRSKIPSNLNVTFVDFEVGEQRYPRV